MCKVYTLATLSQGIVRAFLIEEQKCVKQVLAEKLSQSKEKEGKKP